MTSPNIDLSSYPQMEFIIVETEIPMKEDSE